MVTHQLDKHLLSQPGMVSIRCLDLIPVISAHLVSFAKSPSFADCIAPHLKGFLDNRKSTRALIQQSRVGLELRRRRGNVSSNHTSHCFGTFRQQHVDSGEIMGCPNLHCGLRAVDRVKAQDTPARNPSRRFLYRYSGYSSISDGQFKNWVGS
ncbi:hypothetical protein BDW59DRAFT_42425 [Aspergillus cavernicola]|uniref:Uncharacterized protein n=1 Tax=Aspergillus cavernicola TaxID=176166 RepID=A0ABR4ILL8_9EURO